MFDPAPAALVGGDGRPNFGVFGEPIRRLDLDRFDYRTVAPFPLSLSSPTARKAIKRWQYLGVVAENLVLGAAVADIGYAASSFAYVYDRAEGRVRDFSYMDLGRTKTRYSASSVEGVTSYESGAVRIVMNNDTASAPRRLELAVPGVTADIRFDESGFKPLCAVTQNGLRGFNYCHKGAALPVTGSVTVDGRTHDLAASDALGVLDWTAGCAARYTFWNWACGSGRLDDGRLVGCNFASGINERGFTENVYWVDGRPVKTDTLYFHYNPARILDPWTITSSDGRVDLRFEPEKERSENLNLGLVLSRFHQPFGTFTGTLVIDGKPKPVRLRGYVEEHEAKW